MVESIAVTRTARAIRTREAWVKIEGDGEDLYDAGRWD
jgi:hypothetical protein